MPRTRGIARQHLRRAVSHIEDALYHLYAVNEMYREHHPEIVEGIEAMMLALVQIGDALTTLHDEV